MEDEATIAARAQALVADGYSPDLANALANRGVSVETATHLSKREVLEHYLEWNGIIGYTGLILNALDNIEANCHY